MPKYIPGMFTKAFMEVVETHLEYKMLERQTIIREIKGSGYFDCQSYPVHGAILEIYDQ